MTVPIEALGPVCTDTAMSAPNKRTEFTNCSMRTTLSFPSCESGIRLATRTSASSDPEHFRDFGFLDERLGSSPAALGAVCSFFRVVDSRLAMVVTKPVTGSCLMSAPRVLLPHLETGFLDRSIDDNREEEKVDRDTDDGEPAPCPAVHQHLTPTSSSGFVIDYVHRAGTCSFAICQSSPFIP